MTYKVAGHLFSVEMDADSFIWERMEEAYGPFEVSDLQDESEVAEVTLFCITIHDSQEIGDGLSGDSKENMTFVYSNKGTVEPGFVELSVYKNPACIILNLPNPCRKQSTAV